MNKLNLLRTFVLGLSLSFTPSLFAQCPTGDVILTSQAEVNSFVANYGNCSIINGSLTIGDNTAPIEFSDIDDISGLSNLNRIGNNLIIAANPILTDLNGIENIIDAGWNLQIIDNDQLQDISALDGIVSIGRYLDIIGNDALTSIPGLNDINASFIVTIKQNNSLISISGINNLDVGRGLIIRENDNLLSISGLQNFNPGVSTGIVDNPNLIDISGFSITGNSTPIVVTGNTSLNICDADGLCELINTSTGHLIENNGLNCSSIPSVEIQCSAALPVSLVSFEASKIGKSVTLEWTTAQERNNAGFFVQYSSDAQNWVDLTFIAGQGNSDRFNNYTFKHQEALGSKNYYRLKQIDFDGQYQMSEIKIVRFTSEGKASRLAQVYPNPSSGRINIQFEPVKNSNSLLKLSDSRGQVIWMSQLLAEKNPSVLFEQLELPANQLFFLSVQSGKETQVLKIQTIDIR